MLCTQACTSVVINDLALGPFLQNVRKKQRPCVLSTKIRTFCKLQKLEVRKVRVSLFRERNAYFTLSLLHAKNHLKSPE